MVLTSTIQSSGYGDEADCVIEEVRNVDFGKLITISTQRDLRLFEELEIIEDRCTKSGWDEHAAKPIPKDAFDDARNFLYHAVWESGLPMPEVEPDEFGAIQFDWSDDHNKMYSLSFYGQGIIGYSGYWGENMKRHGVDEFTEEVQDTIYRDILRTTQSAGAPAHPGRSEGNRKYYKVSLQGQS